MGLSPSKNVWGIVSKGDGGKSCKLYAVPNKRTKLDVPG